MSDVQNAITLVGGLMGIAGTVAALFAFFYKRGGHDAASEGKLNELKAQVTDLKTMLNAASRERSEQYKDLETKLDARIVTVDDKFAKMEVRVSALNGLIDLLSKQRSEDREYLLEHYMTNENIEKIEKRTNESTQRMFDQLQRLEDKLDQVLGMDRKFVQRSV